MKFWSLVLVFLALWSCSKTEPVSGEVTFVVTANVHGQLDPCG